MDMSWRTQVGGGIALTHGWAAVIGAPSKIGHNVTIFHGVTLGGSNRISRDGTYTYRGHPTLEDDVWVGPNAVVTGKITIGRGSRIAAGAFVTHSVPPYSLVVGNPAKIVIKNCIPDVMNPAPTEAIMQQC
jgi:serine O-acetyltransferase